MVAFHAASGAAAGSLSRSRLAGLVAGPLLHVAADRVPHRHPRHEAWEYVTGMLVIGLLVRRRGLFDAATLGAASAVLPDLEHLVAGRCRKLFHPFGPERRDGAGLSVEAQLLLSATLLFPVLRRPGSEAIDGQPTPFHRGRADKPA